MRSTSSSLARMPDATISASDLPCTTSCFMEVAKHGGGGGIACSSAAAEQSIVSSQLQPSC
jgi:hypothetical protein